MADSGNVGELCKALAKAQGEMRPAVFDCVNPHFKSKYASLASIWNAIREPLSKNGLSITHEEDIISYPDGTKMPVLVTKVRHGDQWISSAKSLPANVRPQEYGSALTYAKRYSISGLVGIVGDEDDDANLANKAEPKRENPHVNRAEDFTEHEVQYDSDGNPVDNIPYGNPQLQPLRKAAARKEYEELQKELIAMTTVAALRKWANRQYTMDRVHTLPNEWQAHMRDLFEGKKKELSLEEGNAKKHRPEQVDVAAAN